MAITVNLKPRSFSPRCTSRDPDGIAVAPDAPITIIGTVAHGNEVILRTASLNFGGVAPEFVRRVLLQPANAGSDYVPQAGVNYQQGRLVKNGFYYQSSDPTKRIPVHAVAGMPNGVAFAVGDKGVDPDFADWLDKHLS